MFAFVVPRVVAILGVSALAVFAAAVRQKRAGQRDRDEGGDGRDERSVDS